MLIFLSVCFEGDVRQKKIRSFFGVFSLASVFPFKFEQLPHCFRVLCGCITCRAFVKFPFDQATDKESEHQNKTQAGENLMENEKQTNGEEPIATIPIAKQKPCPAHRTLSSPHRPLLALERRDHTHTHSQSKNIRTIHIAKQARATFPLLKKKRVVQPAPPPPPLQTFQHSRTTQQKETNHLCSFPFVTKSHQSLTHCTLTHPIKPTENVDPLGTTKKKKKKSKKSKGKRPKAGRHAKAQPTRLTIEDSKVKEKLYNEGEEKKKFGDAIRIYTQEIYDFITSSEHMTFINDGGPLVLDFPNIMYHIACGSLPWICKNKNQTWIEKCIGKYSKNHERREWIKESQMYALFFSFISKYVEEKQLERAGKDSDDWAEEDTIKVPYDSSIHGVFVKYLSQALKRCSHPRTRCGHPRTRTHTPTHVSVSFSLLTPTHPLTRTHTHTPCGHAPCGSGESVVPYKEAPSKRGKSMSHSIVQRHTHTHTQTHTKKGRSRFWRMLRVSKRCNREILDEYSKKKPKIILIFCERNLRPKI